MVLKKIAFLTAGTSLTCAYICHHSGYAPQPPQLSETVFRSAMQSIDGKQYQRFPRAGAGKTPVFLPPNLPVVLKQSGPDCEQRLRKMEEAREICDRNGYTHLAIPSARIHGDFLIEERLPILQGSVIQSVGLYIKNKDSMTKAIREFTGFLCQSSMTDIRDTRHPIVKNAPTAIARFDNIALYLDKDGEGKIGLVDLEHFETNRYQSYSWEDLITFFPFHFDEILEEASKFHPHLNFRRQEFETKRDAGMKTYQQVYLSHLKFCEEKKIKQANGNMLAPMSESRKNALEKSFIEVMHKWYNYDAERDYFNFRHRDLTSHETGEMQRIVHESFPQILDQIRKPLSQRIGKCNDKLRDLVDCRSFFLSFPDSDSEIVKYMSSIFHMEERNHGKYAEVLILHLMEELAKGGDIYEYIHNAHGQRDFIRV
jgi:hypothetical protein